MDPADTPPASIERLSFDNRFARLGDDYASRVAPTPLRNPRLLHVNDDVARLLDLDPSTLDRPEAVDVLAGNRELGHGAYLSTVYAGHQFGVWVPQLGDGRAILVGQVRNRRGESWDLQLKGAGRTPYSRFGDGRAVVRSSVREHLAGEALHHLGIPTTRSLALVVADDPVQRETIEQAAVLSRVAPSHVRFGHFELFYSRGQHDRLAPLADHVIDEHFPQLTGRDDRHARWLEAVTDRTAALIARWQSVGFCHGVLNTDNMSVLGITLDYGPFGFIDAFDAHHICNHSDPGGRYAYDRQPLVGHWNCSRLIQACVPLLDADPRRGAEIGQAILDRYPSAYAETMTRLWRAKFGLRDAHPEDSVLINRFLSLLDKGHSDFTLAFRLLSEVRTDTDEPPRLREHILDLEALDTWLPDYRARLRAEDSDDPERRSRMNACNPRFVLRNHLAQRAIADAQSGSSAEIERLLHVLRAPFDEHPGLDAYAAEPPADQRHIAVSCSS